MFVSIQKTRSCRANGHTRKYCRNSLSNAPAMTREAEEGLGASAMVPREFQHCAPLEREDCTPMACYRSIYAPRTGGAYDSYHRTAGIAGRTRRRGGRVAAGGAREADRRDASHRTSECVRGER